MNFGQKVEEKSHGDTIPKDTLVWCVLSVRGIKFSRQTNGRYLDVELTVAEGQPYQKRKIWDKIPDPFDTNNSEEWRNMGYGTIRRILEAVKGATPENQNSYTLNQLEDLNGLVVPICVGIEKGNDQYPEDKNRAEYLSPHSSIKKVTQCYSMLMAGEHQYGKKEEPAGPQQGSMFAGTGTPPPAQMQSTGFSQPPAAQMQQQGGSPEWLAQQQQQPQEQQQPAQATGFTQGQAQPQQQTQQYAAPVNNGQPQQAGQTGAPAAQSAMTTSPSNQGGWNPPQQAANAPVGFPGQGQG